MKLIGTWEMSRDGLEKVKDMHEETIDELLIQSIKAVEDNEEYTSVGYGGLPNINGEVYVDAGYMCGKTMRVGALCAAKDLMNPIEVAYKLSFEQFNSMLAGDGVVEFAKEHGFKTKNLLTEKSLAAYKKRVEQCEKENLSPYDGHDTVCILGMDSKGDIAVGTSTSGLFMKKNGRVGDSPIVGSGFYALNGIGAAAATGLGEDIMKTIISYEIVMLIKSGLNAQEAAEKAVKNSSKQLGQMYGKEGDISVVCIDKDGNFGAASNISEFPYVTLDNGVVESKAFSGSKSDK